MSGVTAMRSETRQRTQIVTVRLTPDERERYAALAARKHRSLPDLMRMAVEAALISEAIHEREMSRGNT